MKTVYAWYPRKTKTPRKTRANTLYRVVQTDCGSWAAFHRYGMGLAALQFHPHHCRLLYGKNEGRRTDAVLGRTPTEALLRLKRYMRDLQK